MIDEQIRSYLLTQTAVTNIVGFLGVYVVRARQEQSAPYIVVEQTGGNTEQHMEGLSGVEQANVDIRCHHRTDALAGTLAEIVKPLIAGVQKTMGTASVRSAVLFNQTRSSGDPRQGDQTGFPSVTLSFEVFYR